MMTSPLLMSGPAESIGGRGDSERALSIHYKEKEREPKRGREERGETGQYGESVYCLGKGLSVRMVAEYCRVYV